MVPKSMPSPQEAIDAAISELKDQLDYYKEHQREQLLIGNAIDALFRLAGQLCVINLILFGGFTTYSQISKELEKRSIEVTSSTIGHYSKADITPQIEIVWALYHLSEDKTKTVSKARQERTPSRSYRGRK